MSNNQNTMNTSQNVQNNQPPNTQSYQQPLPQEVNLLPTLLTYIDKNNISKFKSLLSSSSLLLSQSILTILLLKCFSSYKSGNIYTLRYISILLSYGANPNLNIETPLNKTENNVIKTPLMLAVEKSDLALFKSLIDNKCDVNYKDSMQMNCLFYLNGGKNDIEIIKMLQKEGIDMNCKESTEGNTPLHYMIKTEGREKVIMSLFEVCKIEDLKVVNNKNKTVIEALIEKYNGKSELKKYFDCIKKNIFIDYQNKNEKFENKENNEGKFMFINNIENNEKIMFKLTSTKENSYIKMNPKQVILINNSLQDNNAKSNIKDLENMNNQCSLFLKNLQEINFKKINENKACQTKIAKLKNLILQKKNIITQLTQTFNTFSVSHKDKMNVLRSQYNDKIQTLHNLKTQISNSNTSAFSFINHQNLTHKKYLSQEFYSTPYVIKQLQYDLLDFNKYVSAKILQKKPILTQLIALIEKFVTESLGSDYSIKIYGSHATKLCLPWSDIDIVVSCPTFTNYTPLYNLSQYIESKNIFKQVRYIGKTQVPLIKIITKQNFNNISVDISLEDPKHYGVQCVNFVNEMIKKYEVLMPMTLAIKNILQKANLNDPYKGGLSSYGVLLLILNFLILEKNTGKEIGINNLGNIFYEFLFYYGTTFDPTKGIIDVSNRNDLSFATQFQLQMMNGELVIVDPLNIRNNVGKNTRQFQNIKLAFMIGYRSAKECCECGCHYQYGNFCVNEEGVEHCLLKRIFNAVKRVSQDEWGK